MDNSHEPTAAGKVTLASAPPDTAEREICVTIVSEDIELAAHLGARLARASITCSIQFDGKWPTMRDEPPSANIVILDARTGFGQPEFGLAQIARRWFRTGFVLLGSSMTQEERVLALSSGVDHVLAKPVDPDELVAIIKNLARFTENATPTRRRNEESFKWRLEHSKCSLIAPHGEEILLSDREYSLLSVLMAAPGIQRSREELDIALRTRKGMSQSRSLDVLISKLRAKIEQQTGQSFPLRSVRGIGYIFVGAAHGAQS